MYFSAYFGFDDVLFDDFETSFNELLINDIIIS